MFRVLAALYELGALLTFVYLVIVAWPYPTLESAFVDTIINLLWAILWPAFWLLNP